MVLLAIDTQKAITTSALYAFDRFVESVKQLIKRASENSIELIYVRHDDGEGALTKGQEGFEFMWKGRYGECITLRECLDRMIK